MTALLDSVDGPLARCTGTTSVLGSWLDHTLLDPLGCWLSLLGARSAIPECDLLWCIAGVRSVWPLQDMTPHSVTLLPGPVAWLLLVCGFSPLARRPPSVVWYTMIVYCTVLLVSYPISHEEGARWDKLVQNIVFGQQQTN